MRHLFLIVMSLCFLLSGCDSKETQPKTFRYEGSPNVLPDEEKMEALPDAEPFPQEGMIEYAVPKKMRVGDTARVEVRISREQLDTLFEESEVDVRKRENIDVYEMMSVKLDVDPSVFEIVSAPEDTVERVGKIKYAAWVWYIKALQEGHFAVIFRVNSVVGHMAYQADHVETITVEVGPPPPFFERVANFWQTYWQWFIGTLIAIVGIVTPIMIFMAQRKKK